MALEIATCKGCTGCVIRGGQGNVDCGEVKGISVWFQCDEAGSQRPQVQPMQECTVMRETALSEAAGGHQSMRQG